MLASDESVIDTVFWVEQVVQLWSNFQ